MEKKDKLLRKELIGGTLLKMNKTKRIAFGIGIVLAVLAAFTAPVAAGNSLYFVPHSSSAEQGGEVTVDLILNTTQDDIRGVQCHIDLNDIVLNVTAGESSFNWDMWNWKIDDDPTYGPYLFMLGMEFGGCGPGEINVGTFTFKGETTGISHLDFIRRQQPEDPPTGPDPTKVIDTGGDRLTFSWTNDTFTCTGPAGTFEKELVEGWNLISLPLIADNMEVASVFASVSSNYSAVHRYDAETNHFVALSADNVLENGVGYFIRMTSADTWTYEGTIYGNVNVGLSQGLNMVGWLNGTKDIEDALSSIAGKYRYAARWNSTTDKFEVYVPNAPAEFNDFNTMEQGRSYFVSMKVDGETLSEVC